MSTSSPGKGDLPLEYSLGMAPGTSADRPLPAAILGPTSVGAGTGLVHSLTLSYGVTDRFAPFINVRLVQPGGDQGSAAGGAVGGRFQITAPGSAFKLAVAAAALREVDGNFGAYGRVALSYDLGRFRFAGNLHAEHIFQQGRDALDLLVMAGTSFRVYEQFRLGAEYVGQDIEESFDSGAEGGARHYAGPTASLSFYDGRFQLVGGPAFGLTSASARAAGRLTALVTF